MATKTELLEHAKNLGLEVDESNTKAEIQDVLDGVDLQTTEADEDNENKATLETNRDSEVTVTTSNSNELPPLSPTQRRAMSGQAIEAYERRRRNSG